VDLVRSIYANWERCDYSEALWAHPDVQFASADGHPHPAPGAGSRGWQRGFAIFPAPGTHTVSQQTHLGLAPDADVRD
jgi:hypothetical protein